MKISSLPAVLTRLIVCMCVACISYLDNSPPTLDFKQYVIVQYGLHFLPRHRMHQQFLEHREHPYRMQDTDVLISGCFRCMDANHALTTSVERSV